MFYKYSNISRLVLAIFLATFFQIERVHAQTTPFWADNWVVGVSPGVTSYFGDLSRYDQDPLKKISNESGPSVRFLVGKKWKNILEFGLNASFGKTSAESDSLNIGRGFKNKFNEFGVYSAVSIPHIIKPHRNYRFDFGLMANYNIMNWRSVSYPMLASGAAPPTEDIFENGLDINGKKKGNSQSTHYFGAGYYLSYTLSPHFTLRLSQTMQLLNTDEFDSFSGPTDINDRILTSEIGLIFRISKLWSPANDYEEIPTFR